METEEERIRLERQSPREIAVAAFEKGLTAGVCLMTGDRSTYERNRDWWLALKQPPTTPR